jgi:hypothetical protein
MKLESGKEKKGAKSTVRNVVYNSVQSSLRALKHLHLEARQLEPRLTAARRHLSSLYLTIEHDEIDDCFFKFLSML